MPEMKEGGVNVTPLIDVVMCLIIFFMLVAKIGVSTGATPMALPTTIMGKKIEELTDTVFLNVTDPTFERQANGLPMPDPNDPNKILRINVPNPNMPEVKASFDEKAKDPQTILISDGKGRFPLREQLKQIYDARKKAGREKDFSVTIRAEKDLPYAKFQFVLAEIASAGIRNVNYGAKKPSGGAGPTAG
jgi:biopolymer transport protein ExbD